MRGPTGVGNAAPACPRLVPEKVRQVRDFSHRLPAVNLLFHGHRDTAGVVAAVFEPSQTVEQDGKGGAIPQVADNSTHRSLTIASARYRNPSVSVSSAVAGLAGMVRREGASGRAREDACK